MKINSDFALFAAAALAARVARWRGNVPAATARRGKLYNGAP